MPTRKRWDKSFSAKGFKQVGALFALISALGLSGPVAARDIEAQSAFVDPFNNLVLRDLSGARYIIVNGGEQAAANLARRTGRKIPVNVAGPGPLVIYPPDIQEFLAPDWNNSAKPSVAIVVNGGFSEKPHGLRGQRFGHHSRSGHRPHRSD